MFQLTSRDKRVLAELHPDLRRAVESVLKHVNHPSKLPPGLVLRPFEGYRSPAAQAAAVKAGNSKLTRSKHNSHPARACDLVFCRFGKWTWDARLPWWLSCYWSEDAGLLAGARWGTPQSERKVKAHSGMRLGWDPGHVELRGWG